MHETPWTTALDTADMNTLVLRNVLWTTLFPGTVVGFLPYVILSRRNEFSPGHFELTQIVGLVAMVLGVGTLLKCIWDFAMVGCGTLAPMDPPRVLVVRGLYRYVRNPMYVGVLTALLGEVLFFESRALFQYAMIWLLIVHLFVVLYEERKLRRLFGASYDEYCRAVRRWLPGREYDATSRRATHQKTNP
jgi:protein-S-isoprenylcysteine O-methyltransferase Ste14